MSSCSILPSTKYGPTSGSKCRSCYKIDSFRVLSMEKLTSVIYNRVQFLNRQKSPKELVNVAPRMMSPSFGASSVTVKF